jgi:hypothetical protein
LFYLAVQYRWQLGPALVKIFAEEHRRHVPGLQVDHAAANDKL